MVWQCSEEEHSKTMCHQTAAKEDENATGTGRIVIFKILHPQVIF